jgi:sRNA-binding protein
MYVINNTFHSSIKNTPSRVLLGYDKKNHDDATLAELVNSLARIDEDSESTRELERNAAEEATRQLQNYNKRLYDAKHKKPSKYKERDFVLVRESQIKPGKNKKLKPNYKGPYQVAKVLNKNRYFIKDIPGFNLTARQYN